MEDKQAQPWFDKKTWGQLLKLWAGMAAGGASLAAAKKLYEHLTRDPEEISERPKSVYVQKQAKISGSATAMATAIFGGPLAAVMGAKLTSKLLTKLKYQQAKRWTEKMRKKLEEAMSLQAAPKELETARSSFEPYFGKASELDKVAELYEKRGDVENWLGNAAGVLAVPTMGSLALAWYLTKMRLAKNDPDTIHAQAVKQRLLQMRRKLPRMYGLPVGTPPAVQKLLEERPEALTEKKIKALLGEG